MNVTCGERTPSVPPENMVMADWGRFCSNTCVDRVREKSFTQPLPSVFPTTASISSVLWPSAFSLWMGVVSAGEEVGNFMRVTGAIIGEYLRNVGPCIS